MIITLRLEAGKVDEDLFLPFVRDNSRKLAKAFYFNPLVEEKAVEDHLSREVTDKLRKGTALSIKRDRTLIALGIITDAAWDSRILNRKVGKLSVYNPPREEESPNLIREVYLKAMETRYDVLFSRVDLENPRVLQMATLPNVVASDVLVTLGLNLHGKEDTRVVQEVSSVAKLQLVFEKGTTGDSEELEKLTEFAYKHSHYHNDPNISSARAEAVYQEWVRNSLRGYADMVVAKSREEIVGYISLKVATLGEEVFGIIDLIAVREKYRRKGIGRMLIMEGFRKNRNRINTLLVRTQVSNLPALRLYCRLGFKPILSEVTFHIWNETRTLAQEIVR